MRSPDQPAAVAVRREVEDGDDPAKTNDSNGLVAGGLGIARVLDHVAERQPLELRPGDVDDVPAKSPCIRSVVDDPDRARIA